MGLDGFEQQFPDQLNVFVEHYLDYDDVCHDGDDVLVVKQLRELTEIFFCFNKNLKLKKKSRV